MIDSKIIEEIQSVLNNKKILSTKVLSNSFDINCVEFLTSGNEKYIVKYYNDYNKSFNAIKSETENLQFLNNLKLKYFPKIYNDDGKYLIISFIKNNGIQPNRTKDDLLNAIITIHSIKNKKYGLNFDTQIGGLKQENNWSDNWVNFYREKRLLYVFEIINSKNKMDNNINIKIEKLLKNLNNYIPEKPRSSLLHGDLWEGNILFNDEKFVGFIDPGSFYGHNELELAYLTWFNPKFISSDFLSRYNNFIKIDKDFFKYEPIYQLYYSLLNVLLWDRNYIKDVQRLLNNIKV